MSIVAGTTTTYGTGSGLTGSREDLSDIIYNISPTETPFMTMAARKKASATYHEWQTDSLAAAAANAAIEGDEASYSTLVNTTRVGNRTQISRKTLIVSDTARAVNTAGREDQFEYELAKKSQELKRDMEVVLTGNQGSSAGSQALARTLGSLESWYTSNTDRSTVNATSGGFSNGNTSPATDATAGAVRTFTESLLKGVIKACWTNGGQPDIVMLGPVNKQRASTFSGIATQYRENSGVKQATITAAAAIYVSDFGELKFVPNRFSRDRTVHVLQSDMWGVAYLRPFKTQKLARTGSAEKALLEVEYTLVANNEASSGVVADLFVGNA